MAIINEDLKFERIISYFPKQGDSPYDPFGPPVRVKTETYKSINDSGPGNSAKSDKYMIIPYCNASALNLGWTVTPYIISGYVSQMSLTAEIQGKLRTYYAFQQVYGRVSPAQASAIINTIQGIGDTIEAVKEGGIGLLKFLVSAFDATVEGVDNQPVPSHHAGAIKIDGWLKGIAKEGGALTGNRTVLSSVDMRYSTVVTTAEYSENLKARIMWNEFYSRGQQTRQKKLRNLQGYLQQRDSYIKNQRTNPMANMGREFPNPYSDNDASTDWLMWAWERNLDPTKPPPDTRRFAYPGYDYRKKRDWFRY